MFSLSCLLLSLLASTVVSSQESGHPVDSPTSSSSSSSSSSHPESSPPYAQRRDGFLVSSALANGLFGGPHPYADEAAGVYPFTPSPLMAAAAVAARSAAYPPLAATPGPYAGALAPFFASPPGDGGYLFNSHAPHPASSMFMSPESPLGSYLSYAPSLESIGSTLRSLLGAAPYLSGYAPRMSNSMGGGMGPMGMMGGPGMGGPGMGAMGGMGAPGMGYGMSPAMGAMGGPGMGYGMMGGPGMGSMMGGPGMGLGMMNPGMGAMMGGPGMGLGMMNPGMGGMMGGPGMGSMMGGPGMGYGMMGGPGMGLGMLNPGMASGMGSLGMMDPSMASGSLGNLGTYASPKIEIGQKLSNSIYANSDSLRYDLPLSKDPFAPSSYSQASFSSRTPSHSSSPSSASYSSSNNHALHSQPSGSSYSGHSGHSGHAGSSSNSGPYTSSDYALASNGYRQYLSQQQSLLSNPSLYSRISQYQPYMAPSTTSTVNSGGKYLPSGAGSGSGGNGYLNDRSNEAMYAKASDFYKSPNAGPSSSPSASSSVDHLGSGSKGSKASASSEEIGFFKRSDE